ncbi:MAG: alpha-amylase family glycosyl hydrolase [Candidatus Bipolaricaulia bacterium]
MALSPIEIAPETWDPEHALEGLRARLADRYASVFDTHPDLRARLDTALADAWTAFSTLYGTDPDAAEWFVRAVDAAVEGFQDRPASLRRLDQRRGASPDWFQTPEQVGYTCYVDHFGGTLDGVRENIPYLKELGVTYLHLMPLLKTRDGRDDGGYAVQDYRAVDPQLGSMDDLRALARDLREENILLTLDFVMNHTAAEHEWARAARDGVERYRDFYLTYEDRTRPDRFEETVPEVFPDFAPGNFTYVEALDRWVWTSFYDFQWDLDYRNPALFVQMLHEMMVQANVGADVLRLDAVPFLWKEVGTNCRNLPECHWILRAYRALMDVAAPGVLFKSEAITTPSEIIRYLGTDGNEGKECDIAYNATLMSHLWHALASENTQLLRRALTNLPEAPETATWLNYVRSHDDIGWGLDDADVQAVGQDPVDTRRFCADYYAGKRPGSNAEGYHFQVDEATGEARTSGTTAALTGLQKAVVEGDDRDVDRGLRRTLLLHNVVFAARGMPLLYSGDEIGQFNDFSYLADEEKAADNRWVHRPPMDWERAALRHEEGRIEQRLFDGIKRLADTRKTLDALHSGGRERIFQVDNDRTFLFERVHGDSRLLVASNFSGEPQAVSLAPLPSVWHREAFADVLNDRSVVFSSGRLVLPPYGYWWLQPDDGAPGAPMATPLEIEVHTEWGEQVYLCGTLEALGAGDPRDALGPLSADDYPVWRAEIDVPADTYFEFRWIKKRDGRVVEWSPRSYAATAGGGVLGRLEGPG